METNTLTMEEMLQPEAQSHQPAQTETPVLSNEQNLELKLRAQELITQARTIQAVANTDVMALYNTDPEVRARILQGEWDFIDVWNTLRPAQTPPVPVRTANGGAGAMNINAMNEQQFEKLNEMLKRGAKVDMSC
ncbi:MAG: hypothetical protein PUD63_00885 [Clostridia bacterium]|nr:hypothetical protein [Clostridia bacterium]